MKCPSCTADSLDRFSTAIKGGKFSPIICPECNTELKHRKSHSIICGIIAGAITGVLGIKAVIYFNSSIPLFIALLASYIFLVAMNSTDKLIAK